MPDRIVDGVVIADSKGATAFNEPRVVPPIGCPNNMGLTLARLLIFTNVQLD